MLNRVFVLDTNRQPLSPCHPARAKELLKKGKAGVFRRFPFTLILKRAVPDAQPAPVTLKVDPGSKTTGMVLVQNGKVVSIRTSGSFKIKGQVDGIGWRYCWIVQHADGYNYGFRRPGSDALVRSPIPPTAKADGFLESRS